MRKKIVVENEIHQNNINFTPYKKEFDKRRHEARYRYPQVWFYIIALAFCYTSYSVAKEVLGESEARDKYAAEYEVYRHSLCDVLNAKGVTSRDCTVSLDRMFDPKLPQTIKEILDGALAEQGIKVDIKNERSSTNIDEIFKKFRFRRIDPDGPTITNREVSWTDVSLSLSKYLKR